VVGCLVLGKLSGVREKGRTRYVSPLEVGQVSYSRQGTVLQELD
jgi:hypothetical protein